MTTIMIGAAAEQRVEGEQPLEIGTDIELLGDAHCAMQLHGLLGDEAGAFADLGLGARGGAAARHRLGVGHQRRTQGHRAGLVAVHRHVGKPVADHLIGRQRLSELLSDFCVFERLIQQRLHDADGFGAERRHRAVDHRLDRRQRIRAVAEQGIGSEVHIPEIEVAGPAAAEPREIALDETGRIRRHQEQAEFSGRAIVGGDTRRDDDLSGGVAVEHRGLAAVETSSPPASSCAEVATSARSNRAARSECANARYSEPSAIAGNNACFCASLPHSAISAAPITTVER